MNKSHITNITSNADTDGNSEGSHTVKHEFRTKRQYITKYKLHNPSTKASEIAEKVGTSISYVQNVLSENKKFVSPKRQCSDRSNGRVYAHGLSFYEDSIYPKWYDDLDVPVVNARTGMKQVGFKTRGDPCTCQVHRSGRVIVFPHHLEWKEWLAEALASNGWDEDQAQLLVHSLNLRVKVIEGGVKVPEGFLPKNLCLKTDWGMVLVKDDSPTRNTLELKLSIPDMNRFLGLPEIRQQLNILTQGTMAYNQLVRTLIPLVKKLFTQIEASK